MRDSQSHWDLQRKHKFALIHISHTPKKGKDLCGLRQPSDDSDTEFSVADFLHCASEQCNTVSIISNHPDF